MNRLHTLHFSPFNFHFIFVSCALQTEFKNDTLMIDFLQAAVPTEPQLSWTQQYGSFIFIVFMFVALWFIIWRPEAKRRKQLQTFREGLKKGDKVITAGGIYGTVKEIKESSLLIEVDSNVTLRIDKNMVMADAGAKAETPQK